MNGQFTGITYLPDGSLYDKGVWEISKCAGYIPNGMADSLVLDSIRRKSLFNTEIGELELVWTGSASVGVSTIKLDGVTVNSAVYLADLSEQDLLKFFIDEWRSFPVVRKISSKVDLFFEALEIEERPFMCSVNWATIGPERYNKIANYDLGVGASFFREL